MTTAFSPRVSIIIPVYNGANYMRQAIDSALSQTYKNREVIVVNDGSTDSGDTSQIARGYGDAIRYFEKANGGVASALNHGIRNMTGEYFSWLSHDDVYYAVKLQRQIDFLRQQSNMNVFLYGDFELIDGNNHAIGFRHLDEMITREPLRAILSASIHGCSALISRNAFDRAGLFNESLKTTQDNEMWFRMFQEGIAFQHLPEVLIKSRLHHAQGQRQLSGINRVETRDFYSWALGESWESVVKDARGLLGCLASNDINLPLSMLRRGGRKKDLKISWRSLMNYKGRIYGRKVRRLLGS